MAAIAVCVFTLHRRPADQVRAPAADANPVGPWWEEGTAVAWSAFGDPSHDKWLSFVREVGTSICDRGIYYERNSANPAAKSVADYYHHRGLRVTSFMSVGGWKTDEQGVRGLIGDLQRQLDDGCDGVHLDMLFAVANPLQNPERSDGAARAVARMRDAVHSHRQDPPAMFAGNTWMLDTPFSLRVAELCDVAWIETWGRSDLELVRIARVARGLGEGSKPTWYHWQPHHNERERVTTLVNLPKALYASCLLEGAVFLCNYQYPVPIVSAGDANGPVTDWRMFEINSGWRQSVLQYARFAGEHGRRLRLARPVAPVLVAFKPGHVRRANDIMRDLLEAKVVFNVVVRGKWPFTGLDAQDLAGYRAIVTPDVSWVRAARDSRVYGSAADLLVDGDPQVTGYCRVSGDVNVVARVYEANSEILICLKQYGYAESSDSVPVTGPLVVSLYCPRSIRAATSWSPDRHGATELIFSQDGEWTAIEIPSMEYFDMIVLAVEDGGVKRPERELPRPGAQGPPRSSPAATASHASSSGRG